MSRVSRVPYHQNVYDLLQIEPGEWPEAVDLLAEYEAEHGSLPASVREWYLVPHVNPLGASRGVSDSVVLWDVYGDIDWPAPLADVLFRFGLTRTEPSWPFVCFANKSRGESNWWLLLDGADDPSVWHDCGVPLDARAWSRVSESFSEFLTSWFADAYCRPDTPLPRGSGWMDRESGVARKPYLNGLWLRAPDEPFHPPVIDFLIDHFGEPEVTPRPGNVSTYTWKPPGSTLRVTADEPTLAGGLSAWWVHAETPERLAEFAELLLPWGTLRDTLRADTDPARDVLNRARGV